MNDERRTDPAGEDLWRRATGASATGTRETIEDWEADLMASVLDDTASAEEHEALEARLADSPALLDAWLIARDMSAADDVAPPAALRRAAKRLLDDPAPARTKPWFAWLRPARRTLEWGFAATALVLVSWAGFELGRTTSLETVAERDGDAPTVIVGDFDGATDPFAEAINREILPNGDKP